ncbi:MAG: TIGR01212 family radical SAM protein [Erysipelotrichaceae bacterium]|nr:TIGR01212 family radical SAM protein [Erysipelotrichaceae bacterium]
MSLKRSKRSTVNPFIYSNDNLRYHSYSYYLKAKYHQKVFKVPLDAGFTCPNRDGTCGSGGCFFCGARGSGDTIASTMDLKKQFTLGKKIMLNKWPSGKAIAYFQAFTNTYAPLDKLKIIYQPFIENDDVVELAIATRPDCLEPEKIEYLFNINKIKPITIELGLQSIHESTMISLNRNHSLDCLVNAVLALKKANIRTCLHIINGLPNENTTMMLDTAKFVAKLNVDGIKIHMLHIINDAILADIYQKHPFSLLSEKEYVQTVIKQLETLPKKMVIERLTGDAIKDSLIAPIWTLKKTIVLNDIAKEMVKQDTYQGKYYEAN